MKKTVFLYGTIVLVILAGSLVRAEDLLLDKTFSASANQVPWSFSFAAPTDGRFLIRMDNPNASADGIITFRNVTQGFKYNDELFYGTTGDPLYDISVPSRIKITQGRDISWYALPVQSTWGSCTYEVTYQCTGIGTENTGSNRFQVWYEHQLLTKPAQPPLLSLVSPPLQRNSVSATFNAGTTGGTLLLDFVQNGQPSGGCHCLYLDERGVERNLVGGAADGRLMGIYLAMAVGPGTHTVMLRHEDDYWGDNQGVRQTDLYLISQPLSTPPPTVTIRGTVYADLLDSTLQGVDIVAGGKQIQTDSNGRYEITGLSPGQITVTASLVSYKTQSQTRTAEAGQTYTVDFRLLTAIDTDFRPSQNGFHFKNGQIPVAIPQKPKGPRRVVGYYPEYGNWRMDISEIQYDKLTHIIYFSISPLANGDLDLNNINLDHQNELVSQAHANGVEVFICVGGESRSAHFSEMASNPIARANFVSNLKQHCLDHNLDGADIDWEPVGEPNRDSHLHLVQELHDAFVSCGLKMTIAVGAWAQGSGISPEVIQYVDWLNIMAYNMGCPHSTLYNSTQALNSWESYLSFFQKTLWETQRKKMVLGVPFYGKMCNEVNYPYAQIMDMSPTPKPEDDEINGIFFNGINTIKVKTAYSFDYGGIMIWELTQDTLDSSSLLNAIDERIHYNVQVPYNGYCIGMSLAARNLYRQKVNPIPDKDWPAANDPQMHYIYEIQDKYQLSAGALAFFGLPFQLYASDHTKAQYENVRSTIESKEPCPIALGSSAISSECHMVLAYKIVEIPSPTGKDCYVYIYDNVYPDYDNLYLWFHCENYEGIVPYQVWSMHPHNQYARLIKALPSWESAGNSLEYTLGSPATLRVIDPDGGIIDQNHSEIDGGYYRLLDIDGDSQEEQVVFILAPKEGQYSVTVIPDTNAEPNATYSLEEQKFGETTVLAQNVPISEIPSEPYRSIVVLPTLTCEQAIELLDYNLVGQNRISRTEFEYTFRLRAANSWIHDINDVTIRLVAEPNNTTVLDDTVHFASIHAGTEVLSDDTFTIRTDRSVEGLRSDVVWKVCDCKMERRADFNNDWSVDFHDFATFAEGWLNVGDNMPQDVYPDGKIDLMDLMIFAEEWLK